MIKPDLIIISPVSVDYPIWRGWIKKYNNFFEKVCFVWSETHRGLDVRGFVEGDLKDVKNIEYIYTTQWTPGKGDWANICMQEALKKSHANSFLLLHQDLLIKNDKLLPTILQDEQNQLISFFEGVRGCTRFCPAFFLIHKDIYSQTSQDFSAGQVMWEGQLTSVDHLGKISVELLQIYPQFKTLSDFGFLEPDDYEHIKGLAGCYHLLLEGKTPKQVVEIYPRFAVLNRQILACGEKIHPNWANLIQKIAELL